MVNNIKNKFFGVSNIFHDIKTLKEKYYLLGSISKFALTPHRLRNFIVSYLAKNFGIVVKNIRPTTLYIDVLRGCNFNCIMCKAGEYSPREYLSFEKFKRTIDMFPDISILFPVGPGEAFLNREFYKMLSYAASKNFYIFFTSNFSVIDVEKFLETKVDEIAASIDSINPDRFRKIRVNVDFNLVVKNLRKLIELKRKRNYKKPIISLKMVVMKENLDEVEDVINFVMKEGIERFYIESVYASERFVPEFANSDNPKLSREDMEKLKNLLRRYKRKGIKIRFTPYCNFERGDHFSGYCHFAFFCLSVDIYGNAFPCDFLWAKPESTFGNIFEDFEGVMKRRYEFLKNFRKKIPDACMGCPIYYKP
ncbi:MAG: radical SAM protein [Candidatus Calescibacterium sp.]